MKPMSQGLSLLLIIIALTLTLTHSQVTFSVVSAASSPSTARFSNAQYQIVLNAITTFSTTFDVSIGFTSAFSITTVSGCQALLNGASISTAQCAVSSNQVIFTQLSISVTVTNLTLIFNTTTALYSGSFQTTFTYYQPGVPSNQYNTNLAFIIVSSAAMTCSLSSSSAVVGATANYSFSYTPSVSISAGSILQVQFPGWSTYTLTNFPSFTSSSVCAGQCAIRTPNIGVGFTNEVLTYSTLYSTSSSASNTLLMVNARNPPSTQSISVTANLLFFISTTSQPSYMTCSTTFAPNTPRPFAGITFTASNLSISATNTISLLLNLSNPVSSISYLLTSYTADLQLSYRYVTSNQQTTPIISSSTGNSILLGNLTNSTNFFTSLFLASFTLTNAPYAGLANTVTFLTQNQIGSTYHSIDTTSVSITSVVSTITTASAVLSSSSIGIVSDLSLSFTSVNSLVSGSKVIVGIPVQISFTASTGCSCSISSTCTVYNTSAILVNINSAAVSGGSNIPISITSINNPATTSVTSSFTITTYYTNTSTPVDTLTTGLTLTATSVTLLGATVSVSSTTVAANSSYTIALQNRNALPSGSYMTVAFPADFSNSAGAALSSFTTGSNLIGTCTMVATSTMSFIFNNCFPNSVPASTTITIVIVNVINPLSTKQTASFQLQTYYNFNLMEYLYSGLTVMMTTPTPLTFASITPSTTVTNTVTNYQLSVSFKLQHYSGDTILLTFPSTITLTAGFSCTTATSGLTVGCIKLSTQLLQITMTTASTVPSSVSISINNVQNNWFAGTNSFSVQTTTNATASTFYMQQGAATATMTPAALTVIYTPTNSLVLLSTSTLMIGITSPFTVSPATPSLLQITLMVPGQFTPLSSCSGSVSGSTCTLSGSTYTLTTLNSFTNNINITFSAVTQFFTSSSAFTTTLSYSGATVASDSTLTVTPYCSSPCKTCSTPSFCSSCLPSPHTSLNNLFVPNNTCLSSCPAGYYLPASTFTCVQCDTSACLTCSTAANSCTSCSTPTFLSGTSCVLTCPNTFYGSVTSCVPCINQCYNCTNATYCLTCVSGYSLTPSSTCSLNCPSNYISLSGVCTACVPPCSTCATSTTRCTSCSSNYILYSNTCILACPLGQYINNNNLCQACDPPCSYCSSALSCITCVSSYYIYNTTQCVLTCPSGTYPRTTACTACSSTCQTCSNIETNCTSCNAGMFFYLYSCYSICPTSTYPYQGTCTTCVTPCSTCLNGAFACSTCVSNYYLLNTSCVTACPSTAYTTINTTCVACPSNCLTCVSSTNCRVCLSGYYAYQGGCVTACPASSPIIVNSACTTCGTQCATCSGSPDNCLTCTLFYYKYSYTCVQSCPVTYYSNQLTYSCESGLSSKIVFFPVLITYLVFILLMTAIKIFARTTSLSTVLTSLSGWMQLCIWCYLLSLLFATYLQPGLTYGLPQGLLAVAIVASLTCNVIHFRANYNRMVEDEYVRKWQDINLNYNFLVGIRFIAMFTHHKFFRIIYSKIFKSIHFSMVAYKPRNLFFISTLFTLVSLLLSEIPVLAAALYLSYNKLLKDQVFYTSVQALIVTIISVVVALIDIYKPDDYFEDTEFMETKRYLQKVNNQSLNKLEDQYRNRDEGSVDGEKVLGMTGGKFVFSKRGNLDSASMNQILFQEQSAVTDVHENKKKMLNIKIQDIQMLDSEALNQKSLNSPKNGSPKSPRSPVTSMHSHQLVMKQEAKINIFEPIQQEEAEYYEVLKYDEQDFKTAAKIQKEKADANVSEEDNEHEEQRRAEFGLAQAERADDNVSLMQYRERREEWNKIIDHRQKLAHHIFNTIDTKELYKIDQPLNEDEEKEESPIRQKVFNKTPEREHRRKAQERFESDIRLQNLRKQIQGGQMKMQQEEEFQEYEPRRRRRGRKPKRSNKQLEEIYLQRLAEKVPDPKRKTAYASSKTFKYEF